MKKCDKCGETYKLFHRCKKPDFVHNVNAALDEIRRQCFSAHSLTFEIFATGEWHGKTYTTQDLEQIAKNFMDLKGLHQVPLKFGHEDAQRWFGQSDGAPALGWVEKVFVQGNRLLAEAKDIPDEVMSLIKGNRYKRCSVELYYDVPVDGKNVGTVLGAVALLGADLPAVNVLRDLTAYLHGLNTGEVRHMQFMSGPQIFTRDNTQYQPEEDSMTPEEIKALEERLRSSVRQEFSGQLSTLQETLDKKNKELEQFTAKQKDDANKLRVEKFMATRRSLLDTAKKLVDVFKLTPVLYDAIDAEVELQRDKYTVEDGRLLFSQDLLTKLLSAVEKGELGVKRTAQKQRTQQNHSTNTQVMDTDASDVENAGKEMRKLTDERVLQLRAANPQLKNAFGLAWNQIGREHPELAMKARIDSVSFNEPQSGELN